MNTPTKEPAAKEPAERPVEHISVGPVRAAIWKNAGANGAVFSATFQRSWKDEATGEWKNATSFGVSELLQLAKCADRVHTRIGILRAVDREEREATREAGEDDAESSAPAQGEEPAAERKAPPRNGAARSRAAAKGAKAR